MPHTVEVEDAELHRLEEDGGLAHQSLKDGDRYFDQFLAYYDKEAAGIPMKEMMSSVHGGGEARFREDTLQVTSAVVDLVLNNPFPQVLLLPPRLHQGRRRGRPEDGDGQQDTKLPRVRISCMTLKGVDFPPCRPGAGGGRHRKWSAHSSGPQGVPTTVESYAASCAAAEGKGSEGSDGMAEMGAQMDMVEMDSQSNIGKKRSVEKLVLKVPKKKLSDNLEDGNDMASLAAAVMGNIAKSVVEGSAVMFKELLKNQRKVI